MRNLEPKTIAVDFDGTIVEDRYPQIGKERPFAFETLKALQQKGYMLILWTCREGEDLEKAVDFCRKHGVEFYAVNGNYEGEVLCSEQGVQLTPRKITAEMFIDDRNFGGVPQWGEIYQQLCGNGQMVMPEKKGLLSRLFG